MPEDKKLFDVFVIEVGKDENTKYWHNIGVGFQNRDGSVNLKLNMFPQLQLQMRERKERQEQQ